MTNKRTVFLLGILFASLNSGAFAAPTVRMLGTLPAKTNGNSAYNSGVSSKMNINPVTPLKKQTTPTISLQQNHALSTVSSTSDSNQTVLNTTPNRLAMKPVKLKLQQTTQTSNHQSGSADPIPSGVLEQLDTLAHKVDEIDLSNYYTKPEIDDMLTDMDTQITEIAETASVENIQNLTEQVNEQAEQIQNLQITTSDTTTIYDSVTEQRVSVTVADSFSPSIFGITTGN